MSVRNKPIKQYNDIILFLYDNSSLSWETTNIVLLETRRTWVGRWPFLVRNEKLILSSGIFFWQMHDFQFTFWHRRFAIVYIVRIDILEIFLHVMWVSR